MIEAVFKQDGKGITAVSISGHAGFAEYGSDIVCASVTSAVQMTANGITEILKVPALVTVEENSIVIELEQTTVAARDMLAALKLHLELLSQDYKAHIKINTYV